MRFRRVLFVFLIAVVVVVLVRQGKQDPLVRIAGDLDSLISASRIKTQMELLASNPHRAGTANNVKVGDAIIRRLQSAGWKVSTVEYEADLPEPAEAAIWLTSPEQKEIKFHEKSLKEDPYTQIADAETPFFAYAPDTDVEAELIYANFGERQDYAWLKQQGIQVAGKIALIRAQGICRGMKQMIAEEEGLGGLLLYPEPRDQGFPKPAYPDGPHLNPWVVQRGSMLRFWEFPGDPYRRDSSEQFLPGVPAMPITPEAATQLLLNLKGDAVPPGTWKGRLETSYFTGPGPARIRFHSQSRLERRKIRSIFASLPNTNVLVPAVMVGTHYDAWVYGASDPASGAAVLLEAADALGKLQNKREPGRPVTLVFWDAEEYGMIASTRWVSEQLNDIRNRYWAFLYVDGIRGRLFTGNVSPGLREPLDEILNLVTAPGDMKRLSEVRGDYDLPGFSSDTIPFSNIAGIPIAQLNYGSYYPMYHSIYDNLKWMESFEDPGYQHTASMAKILSLYVINLTRSDLIPFRFSEMATHISDRMNQFGIDHPGVEIFSSVGRQAAAMKEIALKLEQHRQEPNRKSAGEINSLLLEAILLFTQKADEMNMPPLGQRNLLLGPSWDNGCAGEDFPGIQSALRNNVAHQLAAEAERLQKAVTQVSSLLQKALDLAE